MVLVAPRDVHLNLPVGACRSFLVDGVVNTLNISLVDKVIFLKTFFKLTETFFYYKIGSVYRGQRFWIGQHFQPTLDSIDSVAFQNVGLFNNLKALPL